MRLVGLVLAAALALTGCGRLGDDARQPALTPATGTPATGTPGARTAGQPDPAGVREVEDIVNDLEGVVGSAEAEATAD